MGTEIITPVGRFVQGNLTPQPKIDPQTGQPKLDSNGNKVLESYIALAIPKNDPGVGTLLTTLATVAQTDFPHLFNPQGQCINPKFAWKLQDGDGVDSNGQSVAGKPGFAGCWVFKFATQFAPRCFHEGKFDPAQQIPDPENVIKRGYYIRICGNVSGNGVLAGERNKVPGLFLTPQLVSLVAYGDEIQSGPDAATAFGKAPVASLPPGASMTPRVGTMPAPSVAPSPGPAMPAMPAAPAMPAMPAAPAMPAMPAAPAYAMTAAAQGATREQLLAHGWTDETLLANGLMVRV